MDQRSCSACKLPFTEIGPASTLMISAGGELGMRGFAGRLELGTAGVLRPGPWLAPRALGWLLLLAVAVEGPALAPALVGAVSHHGVALTPMLVAALLVASGGGYALLVRLGERRAPRELAPAYAPLRLACGALLGAALMGLIYAVLLAAGLYRVRPGHTPDWPVQVLYGFATAFLEELAFSEGLTPESERSSRRSLQ